MLGECGCCWCRRIMLGRSERRKATRLVRPSISRLGRSGPNVWRAVMQKEHVQYGTTTAGGRECGQVNDCHSSASEPVVTCPLQPGDASSAAARPSASRLAVAHRRPLVAPAPTPTSIACPLDVYPFKPRRRFVPPLPRQRIIYRSEHPDLAGGINRLCWPGGGWSMGKTTGYILSPA